MRKTFLTFCVAALSLLAVSSCGKIWDEFDSVNKEIEALKTKVTALENKLNDEVSRINTALDVQLKFKVDAETYEVSVSYDNGATWVETGIVANDELIEVEWEEGSDELTLVVGDNAYAVAIYKEDAASIVAGRTNFFLHYQNTKAVELATEGVAEVYVMSKPNGWKAVLDGDVLTVTAPTRAAVNIGAAETEGEILIHATTETGKCKVAKVEVTTGPGLTMTIDSEGELTICNSFASEKVSHMGDAFFSFDDIVFGLATPELFNEDPKAYVEFYNTYQYGMNDDTVLPSIYNIYYDSMEYEEGVCETDVIKISVADVYFALSYEDLPEGSHYVVWAAPADADAQGAAKIEDMVYVEYVNLVHEVEVTDVTHNDVAIEANVGGATNYVIGCVAESYYNSEWNPMTFDDYMASPMGGPWTAFTKYGAAEALGVVVPADMIPAEFNLSDLLEEKLAFNENYKVWIMPIVDHKAKINWAESYPEEDYYVYDYSAFDYKADFLPYVFDVTTDNIEAGGDYKVTFSNVKVDFTSISVDVTLSEGTDMVYYAWYDADEYETFESDAEVMASLFEECYSPLTEGRTLVNNQVNPGEGWYLAALSIGKDGKYGEVVAAKYASPAIPYSKDITVTVDKVTFDSTVGRVGEYTVVFNVDGASKLAAYNFYSTSASTFPIYVCSKTGAYTSYKWVDVVDGKATVKVQPSSSSYDYLIYSAYNVDETGVTGLSEPANVKLSASVSE